MQTKPYLSKVEIRKDRIVSFTKFPFNIPAIKNFSEIKFHEDVTFLVGENGSGKSTFLEGLSEWLGISQEGGSRGTPSNTAPSLLSEFIYGLKNHKKPSDYFFYAQRTFIILRPTWMKDTLKIVTSFIEHMAGFTPQLFTR